MEPNKQPQPNLITPTAARLSMIDGELPGVMPTSVIYDISGVAWRQARWDAEQSGEALNHLSEGIRAVKRILERFAYGEGDIQESLKKDIQQVHELSSRLYGVLGSDLLALINAADTIRDHSRLAFQETAEVVTDLNKARLQAEESSLQAKQSRKVGRKLLEDNLELKGEIERLRREKRLLVKEVKTLREEAAETRKFDSWRLLEQHVLGSIAVHEMILKTPTSPKINVFKESDFSDKDIVAGSERSDHRRKTLKRTSSSGNIKKSSTFGGTLASFRGTFRNGMSPGTGSFSPSREENRQEEAIALKDIASSTEEEGQAKAVVQAKSRLKTKSPIPSLSEVSCYTDDDSASKNRMNIDIGTGYGLQNNIGESGETFVPTNVTFDAIDGGGSVPKQLVSPLLTPNEYLDRFSHDFKPICDPNILRTLAIPSTEQPRFEYMHPHPHPQRGITDGSLFEC